MKFRDILLALCAPLLLGFGFAIAKPAMQQFPPFLLMGLRFTIAALILIWWFPIPKKFLKDLFIVSLIGGTLTYGLVYMGLNRVDASSSILLVHTEVPFGVIIAYFLFKEKPTLRSIFGMIVAFIGLFILLGAPNLEGKFIGVVLLLVGAFAWSLGMVMAKPISKKIGGLVVTAWVCIFSGPMLLLGSFIFDGDTINYILSADLKGWSIVLFLGLVMQPIAYGTWYHVMGRNPVHKVMPVMLLLPLTGLSTAIFLLGEEPTKQVFIGGVIILFGIAMILFSKPKKNNEEQMYAFKSINVIDSGRSIILERSDGSSVRYHSMWLRDNALDSKTRDVNNKQRLITLSDIPINTYIETASLDKTGKNILLTFLPEKKNVSFSANWLIAHTYDTEKSNKKGWINSDLKIWGNEMSKNISSLDYKSARSDKTSLLQWLKSLYCYGFAKMTGGKIESGALIQIADLFGYVRETNYGKWFEVRSEINAINLAYTNLGLQTHTDNPYRDPVPTIQILYCLENSASGGDSTVVDGFNAAIRLKDENLDYFNLLSKYCARFEYRGDKGTHLKSRRPMIELSPDGELIAIRFNNRSAAPITDVPYEDMESYYKAYRAFSNIINDPQLTVNFKLNPGECFITDNTRVLHARTAFSGEGTRWLQGCYVDKDGLLSTISTMLKKK